MVRTEVQNTAGCWAVRVPTANRSVPFDRPTPRSAAPDGSPSPDLPPSAVSVPSLDRLPSGEWMVVRLDTIPATDDGWHEGEMLSESASTEFPAVHFRAWGVAEGYLTVIVIDGDLRGWHIQLEGSDSTRRGWAFETEEYSPTASSIRTRATQVPCAADP